MALVIPRSRVVNLGGGQSGMRKTLPQEIVAQSREDVQVLMRGITLRDTQEQIGLGNPPSLAEADGNPTKPIAQAERRTAVIFGSTLAAAAMRLVESALASAIAKTTTARSGALGDIVGHWQWVLVTPTGARRVTSANPPATLAAADRLILMPQGVPYATNANQAADGVLRRGGKARASSGPIALKRRRRLPRGKPKGAAVGFLEAATAGLKARADFKQFAVYAAFTFKHKVPGERSKMQGSPMIVIRARRRRPLGMR